MFIRFHMKTLSLLCLATVMLHGVSPLRAEIDPTLALLRDKEVVSKFESLSIQEGGRVKPLDTAARFRLLRYHGKQSIKAEIGGDSHKYSAMEWMLVSWFKPELAKDMPVFVVDNSDAVIELGLKGKNQRDRYSYNELLPGRTALMGKMQEIVGVEGSGGVEEKKRTPVQRTLAKLSLDFLDYEMMLGHFDFARAPFGEPVAAGVPEAFVKGTDGRKPGIAQLLPIMSAHFKANPQAAAPMASPWLRDFYRAMLGAMMSGNPEQTLRIFPPGEAQGEVWQSPGSLIQGGLEGAPMALGHLPQLSQWEELYLNVKDPAAFKSKLAALHEDFTKEAAARGEYRFVPMEVSYHKTDYFTNSLVFAIIGLLSLALSWAGPHSGWGRWCVRISVVTQVIGLIYATVGIVIRCIIMQRPPITTLYETIIFITATGVLLALIAEWMTRKGIGLIVAALSGTVGMFLSIRYMNMEGTDTMQQLQAVLITNFWLATHVPTINLGYSAGMVAAILSLIYFVQRLFGTVTPGDTRAKDLTRISYGFIMAGLFLSLVGTVLGGIWANYSWGRFWGWDPKENGALMIVLMNLVILHARLGGYIREVGFHVCNVILGMIVVFSWFGVNQLGVGLHSYGFTDGIWRWLMIFWASQTLFVLYGLYLSFKDGRRPSGKAEGSGAEKPVKGAQRA